MPPQTLSVDVAALEQRIVFLDRILGVASIVGPDRGVRTDAQRACRATVHRDIAAIQLLLGEIAPARASLAEAGNLYVDTGYFHGFALLAFAQGASMWANRNSKEQQALADALARTHADSMATPRGRFDAAASTPRQLIDLLQALSLARNDTVPDIAGRLDERLASIRPTATEVLCADLRSYTSMLLRLSHHQLSADDTSTLETMLRRKQAEMHAAQDDQHHWNLVLQPARLVSFDLLAIFLLALDFDADAQIRPLVERYPEAGAIPLAVAEQLKNELKPNPQPPRGAGGFNF